MPASGLAYARAGVRVRRVRAWARVNAGGEGASRPQPARDGSHTIRHTKSAPLFPTGMVWITKAANGTIGRGGSLGSLRPVSGACVPALRVTRTGATD